MGITSTVTTIILIVGFIMFFVWVMYPESMDKECLEEIAEEVCHNNGLKFDSVTHVLDPPYFYCKETVRSYDTIKFKFLPEEIEECAE